MTSTVIAPDVAKVVEQIVAGFRPRRIVLFGSRARGEGDAGSDIDRLVVMETPPRPLRPAAAIARVVTCATSARAEARRPRELLVRTVLAEGTVVSQADT